MEEDKRRKKLEAAKEKLAAYKRRKTAQKEGKSDSEPSFSQSDTSLSLSPLPLSENGKKSIQQKQNVESVKSNSSSISENIELSNSENDRSLQEIVIANIPVDSPDLSSTSVLPLENNQEIHKSLQNSEVNDSSVISLRGLENFELENNNILDSQNVLNELIKQDQFDSKTESIKSNPFDDLSSITLKSDRITGCEERTSQVNEEDKRFGDDMPYKEPIIAHNSTDLESSNHSTLSLGTSTEYKQYYNRINMGAIDFQDLISHRDDHIKQLTEALQQVLQDRNNLQQQTDFFAQEIADLKEQLVQTTEIIKRNNWNTNEIEKKPSQDITDSTSLQSLANELKSEKVNYNLSEINFDFEDPEFNETISPEERKIVAEMRNKINLYIQQKVEEYKAIYQSELKVLRDQLEYEKNLNRKVPSFKNTEDSVSSLPSIENNDKMEENKFEIDDQLFNETFTQEELNIIADMRDKIYLFICQTIEKHKSNHELEIKVLKDRMENEKAVHDAEIDRLRQLLSSIKSGSTDINDLRQELNEQHSKEMEELRTYFEQRCADIEKHYSEEIFSQQSRKMSGSSVSELESEILPVQVGPCGDAPPVIIATNSPKKDLASLRLEMQNQYHAELEILREDYDNRLDEVKISHDNVVQELEQKYQTLINALKTDLEEAQKTVAATQEVASSGDFEIAEVVESYERRLQEQVMLAKIDIVSALEQQIQTLVSSSGDDLQWPSELLQLRDRLTEHWNSEIREIKEQHAQEVAKLKEDHERSLARALERERRNSLKSGDEVELRRERDNLKKAATNLRHLVAELIKYFTECEDELNNTLVEELLKYGWDKESSRVTDSSDLNESSQSHSGSEQLDTITISPRVKRVHFTPDVTAIIELINETTDNIDSSKDISTEFRTELDLCLARLKQEANAILSITSNLQARPLDLQIDDKSAQSQDKISSLTRQLISETQQKNELNIQLDEFKSYIESLESEKQNLEMQLEQMMEKQQIVMAELDNAKAKINDLVESGRKEIISEGYGENPITGGTTLGGRIASLADLQERAHSFLAEADGTKSHPLLKLVEELCIEADRIMEDAKKDHEDLEQQIEAADKKLRATTVFLEEQAVEREAERDEAHRQISALKDQLREAERTKTTCDRVYKEESQGFKLNACSSCSYNCTNSDFNATVLETVERLEVQMREMTVLMSDCEVKKNEVENELKEAIDKIWVLRDIVRDLESQIEDKNKTEIELKNIVKQLEEKINFELKENEDLRNKFISLEGCEKESQYQEVIRKLESENQKLKVSSELVGPDGVLKQMKTQLSDFEKTIDKRTKDLESLHTITSNTNCSSPSEDMSIRDQIRPPGSSEGDSDLPLEQLARLKDKLIRHARAEDAAMKRIRDLEMQLYTVKQDFDEMQAERDILQEQLSEQLVLISSLQLRLDDQRLRVESAQKQSSASFEHKIYELGNEIQDYKDEIHKRDMRIQDLNQICEETNKKLVEQQKQLNAASEIEKQIVEQYTVELNRLKNENVALVNKIETNNTNLYQTVPSSVSNPITTEVFEDLLADKNADIDSLKCKLNNIEEKLQFYESLNLSKEQLMHFSNKQSNVSSLIEISDLEQMRRQEISAESLQTSGNLDLKKNPNETVFIGSTFQEKYGDKIHSPFINSEFSTIEKALPPCIDSTRQNLSLPNEYKESGDTKRVRFDDDLEITRLNSKISELQNEIKLKDESIHEYQTKLDAIRKKLEFSSETFKEKTEDFADEIDSLKEEKKNLMVEHAEVKAQLHDKLNKLNELEKESERKDKMYIHLAKEKLDLETVIKEMKARLEEFKDYENLVASKNREIFELEKQLAETSTHESLKESLLQKEAKLTALQERISNLEHELENKLKEVDKYFNDYQETKRALEEKTNLLTKYENENKEIATNGEEKEKKLKECISKHEQRIIELEIYLEETNKKLEIVLEEDKQKVLPNELESEITKLKKELSTKELILNQNNHLIEELNKEVRHLQEYLNEKDKIINQMTVDSNSLHVALEAIQTKIQESGNVVDLKKRLREEQNLSAALFEELKFLKQSIEHYETVESKHGIETLVLLKESAEREKTTNQELIATKDILLGELDKLKEKLKTEEENVQKLKQLLEEEKMNSNLIQIQDANIIESMRIRLESLINENPSEDSHKFKQMLDEERVNFNMIHIRDVNTIETLKVQIDELLRREHDSEKLLKIERRIREELERQLTVANSAPKSPFKIDFAQQQQGVENDLRNDADASHLFGKFLKSESYRKALIFQKRYLLGLLVSYQTSNQKLSDVSFVLPKIQSNKPINRFRAAVYAVISIHRMQYIVRRWHSGKRIGSSIILRRSQTNSIPSQSVLVHSQASHISGRYTPTFSRPMSQPVTLYEARPWSGNSPPSKDRIRRPDLPLGNTIQESMALAPLQAPALLSQYIDRFDSIQQRLGLAIDRAGT